MSFIYDEMPWHEGEEKMHKLTKVPTRENPTTPFLVPGASRLLQTAPLLALGILDKQGRPWASLWGGEAPVARSIGDSIIGIRSIVDSRTDPVAEVFREERSDSDITAEGGAGRMVSGLSIDLAQRRRLKLYGRMIKYYLEGSAHQNEDRVLGSVRQAVLAVKIEQSVGNCPKYINCKRIRPILPQPKLVSDTTPLVQQALDLIAKADTLFVSSADHHQDMDMNIRGGPAGFVRVQRNDESGTALVWPEYSGNNLYQTLGNLQNTPRAGLVFPDFETGDVLYVTGNTQVLIGKDATKILSHSNLAVRLTITGARFVQQGLPFRGDPLEMSPYTPNVRYLTSEKVVPGAQVEDNSTLAKLIKKERLTPTIYRYRFSISDPLAAGPWKPGQYVALSFYDELYMGYSHMRDDDPKSLNDDLLRTFTISSPPGEGIHGEEFEITVRKVGNVTNYLTRQNERSGLEVPLRGFGGELWLQKNPDEKSVFIAGGIGITPLLSQLRGLDMARFQLFWSVHVQDVGLVYDTFKRSPFVPRYSTLFISGQVRDIRREDSPKWEYTLKSGARIEQRRLRQDDIGSVSGDEWYLCTGTGLRKEILKWLEGKRVHYEDFNY